MSLTIIIAGNTLALGLYMQENNASYTQSLPRKNFGEGDYEENLKVHTAEGTEEITVTVEEQQFSQSQIDSSLEDAYANVNQWFTKNVSSKNGIRKDISFPSEIPDNPAQLFWSTDSPDLLSWSGKLGEDIPEKGSEVTLRCTISIGENELIWEEKAMVFPPSLSQSEQLEKNIQKEAENISGKEENKLLLPSEVQGAAVSYQRIQDNDIWLLCILSLLLGLGIFPLAKEREKQAEKKRSRQMQRDYPDIIQKLILFLKAGLSIQKSIEKLAADYLSRKKLHLTDTRYAYEELVKTCREMEKGIYEKEAYERFGRRCGLAEYKILSVLLVQNLKKGNQSILELLEREAVSAGEERLRRAKIQGEEASTKLLLPMILQLLVVLIILMVPAFINFF